MIKDREAVVEGVAPVVLCSSAFLCLSQIIFVGIFVSADFGINTAMEYGYEAASGITFAILAVVITVLVSGARQYRLHLLLMALVYMLVFSLSNGIVESAKSDYEDVWLAKALPFKYTDGMTEDEFCFNYMQALVDEGASQEFNANKVCPQMYSMAKEIGAGYANNVKGRFSKVGYAISGYEFLSPFLMFVFYYAVIYAFWLLLTFCVDSLFGGKGGGMLSLSLIGPSVLYFVGESLWYVWSVTIG